MYIFVFWLPICDQHLNQSTFLLILFCSIILHAWKIWKYIITSITIIQHRKNLISSSRNLAGPWVFFLFKGNYNVGIFLRIRLTVMKKTAAISRIFWWAHANFCQKIKKTRQITTRNFKKLTVMKLCQANYSGLLISLWTTVHLKVISMQCRLGMLFLGRQVV